MVRSEAELRELVDQTMRDERDLVAQQIRFHVVKVFAARDAEAAVAEAKHPQEILQLLEPTTKAKQTTFEF